MPITDEESKEVYARFGLTYYFSEVLHRGLCNFYALSQVPKDGGGYTSPRMNELLEEAYSCTFGRIVNLALPFLPPEEEAALRECTEKRNFLAHYFWFERVHLMTSPEGVQQIRGELAELRQSFEELSDRIDKLERALYSQIGVNDEQFKEALQAVLQGKDREESQTQRKLRKEEIIIAAFQAPRKEGGKNLVFQTKDCLLWQLCDVGLGWTAEKQIEETWTKIKELSDTLPAHINPRPKISKPWNYEIFFGKGKTLVIKRDNKRNMSIWKVRINKKKEK